MRFLPQKVNYKQMLTVNLVSAGAFFCLLPSVKVLSANISPALTTRSSTVSQQAGNEPILIAQQSRSRRIQFARGRSSATVQDAVVRGTTDTYVLNARANQTMRVNISSVEDNAVFDVVAPNGQTLESETTSFSGKLPATGDYRIVVGGTRGNATYKLQVGIN